MSAKIGKVIVQVCDKMSANREQVCGYGADEYDEEHIPCASMGRMIMSTSLSHISSANIVERTACLTLRAL